MSNDWQEKTCLVTGASAGLGLAVARALATRWATVLLNARSIDRLQNAVELLQAAGCTVEALPGDVTSPTDVHLMTEEVTGRFGGLDLLCNCAGLSSRGRVLETSIDDFQRLWELNFLGTVRMTKAFASGLCERRGHLINIGSLAGKVAPRYMGAYPASKFAVTAYSQQLRLELGPTGLHVLLVCPGPLLRDDSTPRYGELAPNIPESAQAPGGGAKVSGVAPDWLADRIVTACERRESELIVPGKARLLLAVAQLSTRWGDWLLSKLTASE